MYILGVCLYSHNGAKVRKINGFSATCPGIMYGIEILLAKFVVFFGSLHSMKKSCHLYNSKTLLPYYKVAIFSIHFLQSLRMTLDLLGITFIANIARTGNGYFQ